MTELLTAAQMRAIEQAAIQSGQVAGLELMERAGQGAVDGIFDEWSVFRGRGASPSRSPRYLGPDEGDPLRALVLCGPGNNGGDGFVVARLLRQQGWDVDVCLFGDPEKLPPDARTNYERWTEIGVVTAYSDLLLTQQSNAPNLIVDALFGTGLTRPVEGELAEVVRSLHGHPGAKVVAIDIPSGLCSDSGKQLGACVTADLTVAFHRAKRGHYLECGALQSGRLVVAGIGLDSARQDQVVGARVSLVKNPTCDISKQLRSNKYSFGHALMLSGGSGKTGAARLAARGALRIGAGLVTLGVPPSAQLEVASQITALMLQRVADGDSLSETLKDTRLNAICLGPGLGQDRARELVPLVLSSARRAVLDADALSAFAGDPDELFAQLHESCVLTPHGGEFARLFPDIAERLAAAPTKGPAYSKVDATRAAAKRAGCIVLFKGPDTVIAAPDGRCSIHAASYNRAAPWLATAGSGDVLAGFVTGLLARGFPPMQAAETAAWLHVECARHFGPGLIAEDLSEQIPAIFRQLDTQF